MKVLIGELKLMVAHFRLEVMTQAYQRGTTFLS
jgi:hypothetical protein